MAGFADSLREGRWLSRERVRLVGLMLLAEALLGAAFLVATSDGRNDRFGRPLGTDFANVYAAGTYVLDGEAAKAFDPRQQYAREQAIFGEATPFYGWHYPPFFLGVAALLAAMPYWLALLVWQGVTLALYVFVIRKTLLIPPLKGEGVSARRAGSGGVIRADRNAPPPGSLRSPPSPASGGGISGYSAVKVTSPADSSATS